MTFRPTSSPSRRQLAAGLVVALVPKPLLADPADRPLRFAVFRNGAHVGEHQMTFVRANESTTATTSVELLVRLGPLPVFRYRHWAREVWRADRFEQLETATTSNGKRERVVARAQPDGVLVETLVGNSRVAADAAPLTHWNPRAFRRPLFNPQTGKSLTVSVRRLAEGSLPESTAPATRWSIRGETEIDDWYDAQDVWAGLRGRLPDRSMMEYRRL